MNTAKISWAMTLTLLLLVRSADNSSAAIGDVDLSFDAGSGVNGAINDVVVQPDGKATIVGSFTTVKGLMRVGVARLNSDGSGDGTFNPAPFAWPNTVALQPDGKVLVGAASLVRLNADGSWDKSLTNTLSYFDPEYGPAVSCIALQSNGKILLGGIFDEVNGAFRQGLARLNTNGSLDNTFVPPNNLFEAYRLRLQPDGKALVSALFWTGMDYVDSLVRLNTNGSLDNTFQPPSGIIHSIAVQPDGKVLIGGAPWIVETNQLGVLRLNTNGAVDPTFAAFTNSPEAIALQPDGKVVVAFSTNLVRLNSDGTSDNTFLQLTNIQGMGYENRLALQPEGKILVAGGFTLVNGVIRNRIMRLNASGTIDETYERGAGLDGIVTQLRPLPGGQILVSGGFTTVRSANRISLARLNSDGSSDGTFQHDFYPGYLYRTTLQPDGKVLWAGYNGLGRLHLDGATDATFNPDLGRLPPFAQYFRGNDIVSQPDGKVICAGAAVEYRCDPDGECGDILTPFFYRFQTNGTRDLSFNAPTNLDVSRLLFQPDGKVIVAGRFLNSNVWAVIRFDTNGAVDNSFAIATAAGVSALALQGDGKVLLGGGFAVVNGASRRCIARLNANGTLDNTFNPFVAGDSRVNAVALQPDGKILIGGVFTMINGTNRSYLARLNANGTLDLSLNVNIVSRYPDYGPEVNAIAFAPDGSILIGGDFLTVNGVLRPKMARLVGDSPFPSLNIARTNTALKISWPAIALNVQLRQSPDVGDAALWSAVTESMSTNNGTVSVSVPAMGGRKFFRLFSP